MELWLIIVLWVTTIALCLFVSSSVIILPFLWFILGMIFGWDPSVVWGLNVFILIYSIIGLVLCILALFLSLGLSGWVIPTFIGGIVMSSIFGGIAFFSSSIDGIFLSFIIAVFSALIGSGIVNYRKGKKLGEGKCITINNDGTDKIKCF